MLRLDLVDLRLEPQPGLGGRLHLKPVHRVLTEIGHQSLGDGP